MFKADRLRKLRKDLGLSQVEMGKRLHIEQSTYSKLETNNYQLNLEILQSLRDEFNINPNEFLNDYHSHSVGEDNTALIQKPEISGGG